MHKWILANAFIVLMWSVYIHSDGSSWIMETFLRNERDIELFKNLQSDQVLLSNIPLKNTNLYISGHANDLNRVMNILKSQNVNYTLKDRYKRSTNPQKQFLSVVEMERWLLNLPSKYKTFTEVQLLGQSFEKRNIYALKIGTVKNASSALFEGGAHAREWLPSASLLGVINIILEDYYQNTSSVWRSLLKQWNLYFIPMLNPDGYEYTMTDRFWRKNRQAGKNINCTGIDINRNFPVGFEDTKDPCDQIYSGTEPFSSPETKVFKDLIYSILKSLKAYISFHSFSEKILLPWAYKNVKPNNYKNMENVAEELQKEISEVRNKKFDIGTPPDLMYSAGGTSFDWIKSLGVPYSYTIELAPKDDSIMGFVVPDSEIHWSTQEVLAAITTLIRKTL